MDYKLQQLRRSLPQKFSGEGVINLMVSDFLGLLIQEYF